MLPQLTRETLTCRFCMQNALKIYHAKRKENFARKKILHAKQIGCHIITIPPSIIEKIESFGKTFDQLTKETVKAFLEDSKKSKFKI